MNELLRARLAAGSSFKVKVTPKSSKNEITGELADGTLKIKVAAVPEDGKANAELCAFLARELSLPRGSVEVVSGQTSRLKLIRITAR